MEKSVINNFDLACAKIVHEAKNPIAIISSIAQLIEKQIPEVKNNKHWNNIYIELDNLTNLLSDFNKLNDLHNFDFQPLDLGELLADIIDRFEPMALQRNITLSLHLPDDLFNIDGYEPSLKEAFDNLIKNAFEAVGRNGFISVSISKESSFILVNVIDNGVGIRGDHLPLIFKPFTTFKEDGTGLGLAIVDDVINNHGGKVEVESQLGKGTQFMVRFPKSS